LVYPLFVTAWAASPLSVFVSASAVGFGYLGIAQRYDDASFAGTDDLFTVSGSVGRIAVAIPIHVRHPPRLRSPVDAFAVGEYHVVKLNRHVVRGGLTASEIKQIPAASSVVGVGQRAIDPHSESGDITPVDTGKNVLVIAAVELYLYLDGGIQGNGNPLTAGGKFDSSVSRWFIGSDVFLMFGHNKNLTSFYLSQF
jgi:hypothetical protein